MAATAKFARRVDALLLPLGFTRYRGPAWKREREGLVDLLDLQASRYGGQFAVNLGVLVPRAYEAAYGRSAANETIPSVGTVNTRLGQLTDGRDRWWSLTDDPDVVVRAIEQHGLPFLEGFRSVADIMRALEESPQVARLGTPETLYLAVLKHDAGEQSEACALIRRYVANMGRPGQAKSEPWTKAALELMSAIGCVE